MEKMTHHPLRAQESILKRALVLCGFALHDDARSREIVQPEWNLALSKLPAACHCEPIYLEEGMFMLRTDLLSAQIASWGPTLPLKSFAVGTVYDAAHPERPNRSRIEGVWADARVPTSAWLQVWDCVVREAYGLEASFEMVRLTKDSYEIKVAVGGRTFTLARMARATMLAYALLGLEKGPAWAWTFSIDVDEVACGFYGIADRDDLYNPNVSHLRRFADAEASYGGYYVSKATDLLRARGFVNFSGLRFYEPDCYRKMHMIQEGWDKNNQGMELVEPIGPYTWLPTVLTVALEEALSANYRAGEESCRLFEFGHIFVPSSDDDNDFRERSKNKKYKKEGPREKTDKLPREKLALSLGAYGPDLTEAAWEGIVDEFLTALGIREHYFMDTMQAIAYQTLDCHLVMNDKMRYQMSNFGSINKEALANHGIGVPAYMAQFEFEPLEQQAAEELVFVPVEYR